MKDEMIVGHFPRKFVCVMCLCQGGLIFCRATGSRLHSEDLLQGRSEVPCVLLFWGNEKITVKTWQSCTYHCKKEGLFWLNLVTSVSYLLCIIKYSGDPLPALHSKQWLKRTMITWFHFDPGCKHYHRTEATCTPTHCMDLLEHMIWLNPRNQLWVGLAYLKLLQLAAYIP